MISTMAMRSAEIAKPGAAFVRPSFLESLSSASRDCAHGCMARSRRSLEAST